MCGIAGLLGVEPELANRVASRMGDAMHHRGPDDHGLQKVGGPSGGQSPPAVLVHARLAILDLSPAGHQPMSDRPSEGSNLTPNWIVFNGEVFNYLDLQSDLTAGGWPTRTRCDTETILNAYRVWGESSVERMRGMFVWCLLDTTRGTAWFCRDRLGIKPLYLYRPASGGLLFSSEVRTLLVAGPELVPPRVDASALESFLAQGAISGERSIIEGITLLGPGETLVTDWEGRTLRENRYWQFAFAQDGERSISTRSDAVAALAETLRESVKLRLISDVPLGLFLSGGIDSGALAAVATELAPGAIKTISIGFDDPKFDETDAAAAVALQLGTEHQSVRLTGTQILADMPEALAAIDQPTVDGFNTYYVSRAARSAGLTVALSGLGGDELFGGYASFRDVPRALRMRRRLSWASPFQGLLEGAARATGGRRGIKAAAMFRRESSPLPMYLLRRELFLGEERRSLHDLPTESDPSSGLRYDDLARLRNRASGLELANQISLFELSTYMRHMLLRDADVFSMAHGLELRVPLLDHKLVELTVRLTGEWKGPDPRPKPLLVDAVGPRLPKAVYTSPKRGFTFPWSSWLRGALMKRASEAMNNRQVWERLGIDPKVPVSLFDRFLANDPRVAALQILALLVLGDYAARHRLELES